MYSWCHENGIFRVHYFNEQCLHIYPTVHRKFGEPFSENKRYMALFEQLSMITKA